MRWFTLRIEIMFSKSKFDKDSPVPISLLMDVHPAHSSACHCLHDRGAVLFCFSILSCSASGDAEKDALPDMWRTHLLIWQMPPDMWMTHLLTWQILRCETLEAFRHSLPTYASLQPIYRKTIQIWNKSSTLLYFRLPPGSYHRNGVCVCFPPDLGCYYKIPCKGQNLKMCHKLISVGWLF
jgi:hypothetical protein